MPLPRGRTLRLSRGRKLVGDIMHFSRSVPQVTVERVISIPDVAAARDVASPKPGWYSVLLKGFALACVQIPDLRRSLLTFPTTRLYEHACTVASIAVERELDGEPAVLPVQIRRPETTPLVEIDVRINRVKTAPLSQIAEFRRLMLQSRLPRPIRRLVWWAGLRTSGDWRQKYWGTFGTSSVVTAGGTLHAPLCPLSVVFTFGPVSENGEVLLRLGFDHRVLDGAAAARGLVETENALHRVVLPELRGLCRPLLRLVA